MNKPITPQRRRFQIEWLAGVISLMLLTAVIAVALYRERQLVGAREIDRLQVQARVIDENLIRQLDGVNNALMGVRDEVERSALVATAASTTARLKLLSDAMPGVRTVAIVDTRGVVVASGRGGLVGTNSSQRDFFLTPRARPDRAVLYISEPFKSPLGPLVIAVSRILSDAQGVFAGTVVATLDPEYFGVVLRSVLYAPDMRASLVAGGGQVFVTAPVNDKVLGVNLAKPGSMFSRHRESGQVATLSKGSAGSVMADGGDQMVALRTLNRADLHMDKPLVASVGRDLSAIDEPWRADVLRAALIDAAVIVAASAGLYLSHRRRSALARMAADAAQERHVSAERLDLALEGADLGLWDLHVPTGNFIINARERTLLGFAEDEVLPSADVWRGLIHPDDQARVDAAIVPHLRGEAPTYGCEHRMRHKAGHYVWLSSRAMIVERNANGGPMRIVGTHLDITERRRGEAELAYTNALLQVSEAQLKQVTDSLPALVCRWDMAQRFLFANRAFRDWLDIEPASLLGRTVQEVYGDKAYLGFRHHIEVAMAGHKVVYQREMATPRGIRHVEVTLTPQIGSDGAVSSIYGLINDLTAHHETKLLRARSEERLSLALEGSGLALFDWDIASDRIYLSAQASAMRGEPPVETTTSVAAWRSLVNEQDIDGMKSGLKEALTGAASAYRAEFRVRKRSGDWLWVRARGRVVERDAAGRALRLAGTYADIDASKAAEDKLRHRAECDSLTGLPNRASFIERLQLAMQRSTPSNTMALLFLDIDHFKHINDTHGHEAGDQLLKVFAARMRECVRKSDTVARLAGDEFTIILEALRGADDAKALAGKLVEVLRAPIILGGRLCAVTASVGIAMQRDGHTDDAELLRQADLALYEAKRRGRNGFFCEESDTQTAPSDAEAATAKQV